MSQPVSLPSRCLTGLVPDPVFRGGLRKEARSHEILAFLAFRNKVSSMPHHVSSRLRQHGPVQPALAQLLSGACSVFAIPSSAAVAVPVGKSTKTPFLRSAFLVGRPRSLVFRVDRNGQRSTFERTNGQRRIRPVSGRQTDCFFMPPVSTCFFLGFRHI